MMVRFFLVFSLVFATSFGPVLSKKYQIKELGVREAGEYEAHQDFQNVVIGALAYDTQELMDRLFDVEKMYEKQIMPILVVVQNNNDFAIRIHEENVVLVYQDGTNVSPMSFSDALLRINLNRPMTAYSTKKEILVKRSTPEQMYLDFEHKSFGEKLIAPHSSDHGVLFFWLPPSGSADGTSLYIPEVVDLTSGETLMFFEFSVKGDAR